MFSMHMLLLLYPLLFPLLKSQICMFSLVLQIVYLITGTSIIDMNLDKFPVCCVSAIFIFFVLSHRFLDLYQCLPSMAADYGFPLCFIFPV